MQQKACKAKQRLPPWFLFLLFRRAGYAPDWFSARVSVIKEKKMGTIIVSIFSVLWDFP
jgi:hypothetical protein